MALGKNKIFLDASYAIALASVTDEHHGKALELFEDRADKTWSLVDCISFVVMEAQGLTDVLTTDRPFGQAGFNALLRR